MKKLRKILITIRIGFLHARYHKHFRNAIIAKEDSDIKKFKVCIYKAEDCWKQIVLLNSKLSKLGVTDG